MQIPISIESIRNKNAKAKALIDLGATSYFNDWGFVRKNLIPTYWPIRQATSQKPVISTSPQEDEPCRVIFLSLPLGEKKLSLDLPGSRGRTLILIGKRT